jgi:hypothetical protein
MTRLFSLLAGWKGVAAIAVLCFLAGAGGTWRVMTWREQAQGLRAAVQAVKAVERRDKITFDVGTKFETVRAAASAATRRRQQEVPRHVTPKMDRDYPVPCGFVRVFNTATHGPVPDAAACPDDSPSGVALSEVGQAETENDGQYDAVAEQLKALQDWVRRQQGLAQ